MVALANSPENSIPSPPKRRHRPQGTQLAQAVAVQRTVFDMTQQSELGAKDLAALARAWCDTTALRLRIQMKGPPKAVDVAKADKRTRSRSAQAAPVEPVEPAAPQPVVPSS